MFKKALQKSNTVLCLLIGFNFVLFFPNKNLIIYMAISSKKPSPLIKIIGWMIALFAFAIGFWHTHLGLKEFRVLSSEYGSLLVAGIVLLVMILGYTVAVSGRKVGLIFYAICATTFFIFNLNSFYPTYLGRTLLKEEAKSIKDSVTTYKSRIDKIVGSSNAEYIQKLQNLTEQQSNLLREIKDRRGTGDVFRAELAKFNSLANSNISADRWRETDSARVTAQYNHFKNETDDAIKQFKIKSLSTTEQNALKLVEAKDKMDYINTTYNDSIEDIIRDNSILDLNFIKTNQQIKTLEDVVTKLDDIAITVNSAKQPPQFALFNQGSETICPKCQKLGTFQHTMNSVRERLTKTDTIGVIFVCLLIDFLAPIAVYFLIRRKEEDENDGNFFGKLFRKTGPQSY